MSKINQLSFEEETIFCGIDVHKKNWSVSLRDSRWELENYSQNPDIDELAAHLKSKYPGANYKAVYEAGFCGFSIQRRLTELGIECIVVNAADVPSSDKDNKRKKDKRDARKLSRELSKGELKAIYVPEPFMEHARSLVRQRTRFVWDQTRCKNRIWHLMMFSGIEMEAEKAKKYWSKAFIKKMKQLPFGDNNLKDTFDLALEEFMEIRKLVLNATRKIRALSQSDCFELIQKLLQSITGIGLINAMIIHTEVMDIKRFKTLDSFCDYVGIVPDTHSTGERDKNRGITHRSNGYLRPAIVESSWVITRKDPAMLMRYNKACKTKEPNQAIIVVAKHLLSKIRYVWTNQQAYITGKIS